MPSSSYLTPLQSFSNLLIKYLRTNILVSGHTDNRGNEIMNKSISKQRADNFKHTIVNHGVASHHLESWGIGASYPITENETLEGREKNRRVEFIVLYRE